MKKLIFALLALCACESFEAPDMPIEEEFAIASAIDGWVESGLDYEAGDLVEETRVKHTRTPMEFWELCAPFTVMEAAACLSAEKITRPPVTWSIPVAVLRPGQAVVDTTGGPVVHEVMHALYARFVPRERGNTDAHDNGHRDPRVWIARGGECSAQGRARRILFERLGLELPPGTKATTTADAQALCAKEALSSAL